MMRGFANADTVMFDLLGFSECTQQPEILSYSQLHVGFWSHILKNMLVNSPGLVSSSLERPTMVVIKPL